MCAMYIIGRGFLSLGSIPTSTSRLKNTTLTGHLLSATGTAPRSFVCALTGQHRPPQKSIREKRHMVLYKSSVTFQVKWLYKLSSTFQPNARRIMLPTACHSKDHGIHGQSDLSTQNTLSCNGFQLSLERHISLSGLYSTKSFSNSARSRFLSGW